MHASLIKFGRNLAAVVVGLLCCAPVLLAQGQAPAPSGAATASGVPDLSGNWLMGPGLVLKASGSAGAPSADVPMTTWGSEKLKAARPPFGPKETFDQNDPTQKYCDPPGLTRLYQYPWQLAIVQTPANVYILFEYLHVWRLVTMNHEHPKDPDTTWLGDSVGRYEGDTLVVDTIGFNDKSWLDNYGHPHSDAMHTVERFHRMSHDVLQLDLTVEDPKAYTKPLTATKTFKLSSYPMGETMCSLSETEAFQKNVMDRTLPALPKK